MSASEDLELGCARCAALEQMLKDAEAANVELGEQLAGSARQLRRAGAVEVSLLRELDEVREQDPKSEVIKAILGRWKQALGHPRANISVSGKRAKVVRAALRLGHTEPPLESVADELLEAIDGLALLPYVGPKGRKAFGLPSERYDDVEHALRDEATIERFRGYLHRAQAAATSDGILGAWHRAAALEGQYASLVFMTAGRSDDEVAATVEALKACDEAFDFAAHDVHAERVEQDRAA